MQEYTVRATYESNGTTYQYIHMVGAESMKDAAEWMVEHMTRMMDVTLAGKIEVRDSETDARETYAPPQV